MWNFNKVGRVLDTRTIQRGLKIELQWVWPWKRASYNGGYPYEIIVTSPQGVVVQEVHSSDKIQFNRILLGYYQKECPLSMNDEDVQVWAFSLETAIERYLSKTLPDGDFLVHVPVSEKASKNFWKTRVGIDNLNDHHLDCSVMNITGYDKPAIYLASKANPKQPGRYLLVNVRNGYIQTTVNLL